MITSEFDAVQEVYEAPRRSGHAEGAFQKRRRAQLARAAELSRLEVVRLSFRGHGLTREELSARCGVAESVIKDAENGKQVSDESWRKLALGLMDPKIGGQAAAYFIVNPRALRV